MYMKRVSHIRKHRFRHQNSARFSASFVIMSIAYLAGCVLGAHFGVLSDFPESFVSTVFVSDTSSGFLSVFGNFGFYGLLFLVLSTTYLGFLLIPWILGVKGFLTGTFLLSFLRSGQQNAYLMAGISICLPGVFVLPALLLLGDLCMRLSFRLLCRLRGAPEDHSSDTNQRALAAIAILFLLAAAIESYAVPALLKLVTA